MRLNELFAPSSTHEIEHTIAMFITKIKAQQIYEIPIDAMVNEIIAEPSRVELTPEGLEGLLTKSPVLKGLISGVTDGMVLINHPGAESSSLAAPGGKTQEISDEDKVSTMAKQQSLRGL